jgi:F-type H+-transporting ATPase subunit epsilon
MADTLQLQLVTPDKRLVDEDVEQVEMPGRTGYLGILPGHAPLLTELGPGELSYVRDGKTSYLAVSWGFAEVLSDKVTILADAAERPEDIDVKRAQAAKARAEEELRKQDPELDYDAVLKALHRAEARLQVAARAQSTAAAH